MVGRPATRQDDRELRLGICGTFDVANYGDLIFPLIAEAELSRRLGALTLHRFSYHDKRPPEWPYAVSSLSALPAVADDLEGLIIGGGHLIRFDKEVAPGYAPPVAGIHHPTGYWLTPALIALQHGLPVVWNAPGVHGRVPAWAHPLMDIALRRSRYVAVRDSASRRAVERFAGGTEVAVVPDTAFHIDRLIDVQRPSPEFLDQRRALGLTDPYLLVQAAAPLRGFVQFFRSQHRLSRKYRLVALPIGPVHGDTNAVFANDGGDIVRLGTWPAPLMIAELIANASAVIGVSLHLSITALVFGVPVFRSTALANAKYDVLSSFGTVHYFDTADDLSAESFAQRVGRREPLAAVRAAQSQVTAHWDRIADVFGDAIHPRAGAETPATLGAFWQALPGFLEASARADRPPMNTHAGHARRKYFGMRKDRTMIDFAQIETQTLAVEPFGWGVIDKLFTASDAAALAASFPRDHFKTVRGYDGEKGYEYESRSLIHMAASAVSHAPSLSPSWRALADDLLSPRYRSAMTKLTGLDLTSLPVEVNVFHYGSGAWLGPHLDLKDKLVTHVLYFNDTWNESDGGRLQILRSGDMNDVAAVVAPIVGNSVVLVRSERSWHAVSRVVAADHPSRRSMTVTFYSPGSVSTMWPPGDTTPLHTYDGDGYFGSCARPSHHLPRPRGLAERAARRLLGPRLVGGLARRLLRGSASSATGMT